MTTLVLTHVMRIAHGIGASIVCAAVFYVAGLLLIPRRWDRRMTAGMTPALIGAALYVGIGWFGVAMEVPVFYLATAFTVVVALVGCVRYRRIADSIRERAHSKGAAWQPLVAFVLLYVLAYVLTSPPAASDYLPLAWTGNLDLMTYVRYTRYLLSLGPSNVADFSYFNFVYRQTPGLFYILGGFSLLFNQDPLNAAMPAQFALVALIGTIAAKISRSVFQLSAAAALAIACIFISGPFFRYVTANYFLSTLMATPILLCLIWTTVQVRATRVVDGPLAIQLAAEYVLLLLIYPFLLFAGIGLQIAAIVLMLLAELQRREGGPARRDAFLMAGRAVVTSLAVFTVLACCYWPQMMGSIDMIVSLSEKGVAGWPLDLISPKAMFAWPGARSAAMIVATGLQPWAIFAFGGIAVTILTAYFWWFRGRTTAAQSAFAGLLAIAVVVYCLYYLLLGRSYQQWKFASYCVLPLSFVVYAAVWSLLWKSAVFARASRSAADLRLLTALPGFVAVALVTGNIVAHAAFDPRLRRVASEFRRFSQVNELDQFREITVRTDDRNDPLPPWLALYYLPHKKVHIVSSRFIPSEPLSLELVSRHRPLLVYDFDCHGVGHEDTMSIRGVGCLLFEPPTVTAGATYHFNRTFLFLSYEGMGPRQPEGRWTTRPTVPLKIVADPQRAGFTGKMHLNLSVNPARPGVTPQRLAFRLGNQRGETSVANQDWISLPVQSTDWTGNRVWELRVSIDLPDGGPILFQELSLTEVPRGRVVQLRPLETSK